MRIETVQYSTRGPAIFGLARWGGVVLLLYAGALGLEVLASNAPGDSGRAWNMLAAVLPFVAFAAVLLYSAQAREASSAAPGWLAAVLVVAAVVLALRAIETPMLVSRFETGFWGAAQALRTLASPLSFLLLLITARQGSVSDRLPAVAIAVGVIVVAFSVVLGVREVTDQNMRDVWQIVHLLTPSNAPAFALIVAGLYARGATSTRTVAFALMAVLAVSLLAEAVSDSRQFWAFGASQWLTATNLVSGIASMLLIPAFAGLLRPRQAYSAAMALMVAVVVAAVGNTVAFAPEGRALFWMVSLSAVSVGCRLLLVLVTVERLEIEREEAEAA